MEHTETKKSQKIDTDLVVKENEDGSFTMEWDSTDPKWSWLNEMTSEDITKIIMEYIDNLDESEKINNIIVEDSLNCD